MITYKRLVESLLPLEENTMKEYTVIKLAGRSGDGPLKVSGTINELNDFFSIALYQGAEMGKFADPPRLGGNKNPKTIEELILNLNNSAKRNLSDKNIYKEGKNKTEPYVVEFFTPDKNGKAKFEISDTSAWQAKKAAIAQRKGIAFDQRKGRIIEITVNNGKYVSSENYDYP